MSDKCDVCLFRGIFDRMRCCDYLKFNNKMRNCPAKNCAKFVPYDPDQRKAMEQNIQRNTLKAQMKTYYINNHEYEQAYLIKLKNKTEEDTDV